MLLVSLLQLQFAGRLAGRWLLQWWPFCFLLVSVVRPILAFQLAAQHIEYCSGALMCDLHDCKPHGSIPFEGIDIVRRVECSTVDGVAQINSRSVPRRKLGNRLSCNERTRDGQSEDLHLRRLDARM